MSVATSAQRSTERFMQSVLCGRPDLASAHHFPMTTLNATGGQVSLCFGFKGYNATFCGGGSAFGYAEHIVRRGRQPRALVCGADELSTCLLDVYQFAGVLRAGKARPFDGRGAVNLGEGAAALLIETARTAGSRAATPLAEVAAFAEAQDGKLGGVRADGAALGRAMRQALARAAAKPADCDAVFALGAGPGRFAAAEDVALASVFRDGGPPRVSVVGVTGYGPASSSLLTIAAAAHALQLQSLPAGSLWGAGAPRAVSAQRLELVLAANIDITGNAHAVVLRRYRGAGR